MSEHELELVARYQMAVLWNIPLGMVFVDTGVSVHGEEIGSDPAAALKRAINECAEKHDARINEVM